MTGGDALRPGAVTSIGSLPHRDPDTAAGFALRHHPDLPAAPQLPRRSPLEGMVAQAARGILGVQVAADGTISVDPDALDPEAPTQPTFDGSSHAGLLAFLSLAAGRTEPVKLQLTGRSRWPRCSSRPAPRRRGAGRGRRRRAGRGCGPPRALPAAPPRGAVPGVPGRAGPGEHRPARPDIGSETLTDVLSSALAVLEDDAITGMHCCGPTDWRLPLAGRRHRPLDAGRRCRPASALGLGHQRPPRPGRLGRVGRRADRRAARHDPDRLWRRLSGVWCELVQAGATRCSCAPRRW